MARLATFVLGTVVAGAAWAHPGHSTPHLLHPADPWLGWALAVALATAAFAFARRRS